MTEHIHPAAPHHIPFYITGPDGSDPLFTGVVVFLLIVFLLAGVAYFKLHSLPEHLGEKQSSAQMQLISILCVLALFTHNNLFWVLALLIAVIRVPDFLTPLEAIARSLKKIAANDKDNTPVRHSSDSKRPTAVQQPSVEPVKPVEAVAEKETISAQNVNKED